MLGCVTRYAELGADLGEENAELGEEYAELGEEYAELGVGLYGLG